MKCSGPNKTHDETRKPWKATEAPVLGRYNTPPLREDLVPRSGMAPEGKVKRKRRGKPSCFFDKRVKPKNLEKVTQIQEKNTTKVNKVKNTPLEKRDKEHCENLEVELKIYMENTPVKEGDQGRPNSGSTPVEKRGIE